LTRRAGRTLSVDEGASLTLGGQGRTAPNRHSIAEPEESSVRLTLLLPAIGLGAGTEVPRDAGVVTDGGVAVGTRPLVGRRHVVAAKQREGRDDRAQNDLTLHRKHPFVLLASVLARSDHLARRDASPAAPNSDPDVWA
jgi:hypothetical protein